MAHYYKWLIEHKEKSNNLRPLCYSEISKHSKEDDCWIIIGGLVFDVTEFMHYHPSGKHEILQWGGKDATIPFKQAHSYLNYRNILSSVQIGYISSNCNCNQK